MSIAYNSTNVQGVTYNGTNVQSITYNGVEVWRKTPPFLVRMRYDANSSTHVKDLVGGYTITTYTGGAVPAAADPFGGNEALNLNNEYIFYGGSKSVLGDKTTVCTWVKYFKEGQNFILFNDSFPCRAIFTEENDSAIATVNDSIGNIWSVATFGYKPPINKWLFLEVNTDEDLARVFINGNLLATKTLSQLRTVNFYKKSNQTMIWGGTRHADISRNKLHGAIYDFCILDGIWHTKNYNVPTKYI